MKFAKTLSCVAAATLATAPIAVQAGTRAETASISLLPISTDLHHHIIRDEVSGLSLAGGTSSLLWAILLGTSMMGIVVVASENDSSSGTGG